MNDIIPIDPQLKQKLENQNTFDMFLEAVGNTVRSRLKNTMDYWSKPLPKGDYFEFIGIPKTENKYVPQLDEWVDVPVSEDERFARATTRLMDVALGSMPLQIKGFHGGPRRFAPEPGFKYGRFRDEFIGSGQGGAALGHGHYISEVDEVGRGYTQQTNLKDVSQANKIADNLKGNLKKAFDFAYDDLAQIHNVDNSDVLIEMKNIADGFKNRYFSDETVKLIQKNKKEFQATFNQGGPLYQVTIHKGKTPDQYDYLRWDKPVPKEKIDRVIIQAKKEGLLSQIEEMGNLRQNGEHSGQAFYKTISLGLDSDKEASAFLLRAGINGTKAPTGYIGGRTGQFYKKGAEKYNFVVFDPREIHIERIIE